MKLVLFTIFGIILSGAERLTELDKMRISLADAKIAQAEAELKARILERFAVIAQICDDRVDASVAACFMDMSKGEISKRKIEPLDKDKDKNKDKEKTR